MSGGKPGVPARCGERRIRRRFLRRCSSPLLRFLPVLFVLAGCATTPFPSRSSDVPGIPGMPEVPDDSTIRTAPVVLNPVYHSYIDTLPTPAGDVTLDVVFLRPEATVALVTPQSPAPTGAVIILTNPWRRPGRRPVGIVIDGARQLNPPEPPYWALVMDDRLSSARVVPQDGLRPAQSRGIAVGGFYPLLLDGRIVAADFPGSTIRAARVVVAGGASAGEAGSAAPGTDGPVSGRNRGPVSERDGGPAPGSVPGRNGAGSESSGIIAVVTAEGSRPFTPGPTTTEIAEYLRRRGFQWALNLDGGRSATVLLSDDTVIPEGIIFRRPGPVGIALYVIP